MRTGLRLMIIALVIVACTKDINHPPIADFSVSSIYGDTETRFELDASMSTDPDEPDSMLWVRWDWNADGIYDYPFVRTKKIIHRFEKSGIYQVVLQVKDSSGLSSLAQKEIRVEQGSAAPLMPFSPNPPDSANNINFSGHLSWVSIDPDEDPVVFDVFLGDSKNLELIASDIVKDELATDLVHPGRSYTWQVLVKDNYGKETLGPVWRFSTHSGEYISDTLIDSRDGQAYATLLLDDIWWMTENLRFDLIGYSYCYKDLAENCALYGRYYETGIQDTIICPPGWYLPTSDDLFNLELYLGMNRTDAYQYSRWRGNDQAFQMIQGGTSGLNLDLFGFRDELGNWKYFGDRVYFGSYRNRNYPTRMILKDHGGIMHSSFPDVGSVPVRCIQRN